MRAAALILPLVALVLSFAVHGVKKASKKKAKAAANAPSQICPCGIIDKTGAVVLEPTYEVIYDFYEGLARIRKNDRYGYIDKKGKIVIAPKFHEAGDFSEGLAVVYTDHGWGYIDKKGNLFIPAVWDCADNFSEGRARVTRDD